MTDFIEDHETDKRVNILTKTWREEKELEDYHKSSRLIIEKKILDLLKVDPLVSGTRKTFNGINISCKINRKWDNATVDANWSDIISIPEQERPFKLEYKEDKKNMDFLRVSNPLLYRKLSGGLSELPAKPAFSINKKIGEKQ